MSSPSPFSFLLNRKELLNSGRLAIVLKEGLDTLTGFFSTKFSEKFWDDIGLIDPEGELSDVQIGKLLSELNPILQDFDLSEYTGNIPLQKQTKTLLKKKLKNWDQVQLNRYIFQDAFPWAFREGGILENPIDVTQRIIPHCFVDIEAIDKKNLLDLLWCERNDPASLFVRLLSQQCRFNGENVVLCGDPGIGKTSFIHYALRHDNFKDSHYFIIHLNCRRWQGLLDEEISTHIKEIFIARLLEYFDQIEKPAHELKTKTSEEISDTFLDVKKHLMNSITKSDQISKCFPIVIIDDVDYIRKGLQHQLLSLFADLYTSNRITIIYACRKSSLKEVHHHLNGRQRLGFMEHARIEFLYPIGAHRILGTRLAWTLDRSNSKPVICRIIESVSLKKHADTFEKYINTHNLSLKKSQKFSYPFTQHQEFLFNQLSNGDIRVIFELGKRFIDYILNEKGSHKVLDDGSIFLGRRNILNLLRDFSRKEYKNPRAPINYPDQWKLLNIHEEKSWNPDTPEKHGNSLIQNILELISHEKLVTEGSTFWIIMTKLGYTPRQIKDGLEYCLEIRLIEPAIIATQGIGFFEKDVTDPPFALTKKGYVYIKDIFYWREYRKLFGAGGRSVDDTNYQLGKSMLFLDILEMLVALILCSSTKTRSAFLLISKNAIFDLFMSKFRTSYIHPFELEYESELDETADQNETCYVTKNQFEKELIKSDNSGIASSHKPYRKYFAVKRTKVLNEACKYQVSTNYEPVLSDRKAVFPDARFSEKEINNFLLKHALYKNTSEIT